MSTKKIKLFCMQKDEDDILEEWIIYHASIFGLENIHIIDNGSGEKSTQILQRFKSVGLNVRERPNYGKKGDYLCEWIKETANDYDIAIPIDIDEFIGVVNTNMLADDHLFSLIKKLISFDANYYIKKYPAVGNSNVAWEHYLRHGYRQNWEPCAPGHENNVSNQDIENNMWLILKNFPDLTISCDRDQILDVFDQLPDMGRYAFCYYLTSRHTQAVYSNPIEDIYNFDIVDCSNHLNKANYNKKFFDPKKLYALDHGHHYGKVDGYLQSDCCETNLILFHYHNRGYNKLIQKCKNDIMGLGHINNINDQRELLEKIKQETPGAHNIQTYLNYLTKGPMTFYMNPLGCMEIKTMSEKIKQLKITLDEK